MRDGDPFFFGAARHDRAIIDLSDAFVLSLSDAVDELILSLSDGVCFIFNFTSYIFSGPDD